MTPGLPPLRLLSAFAAVARRGSIQSAAAELNVTQPAISQAVRQLETLSGLRLLDRTRRPARPTEAGQVLADAIMLGLGRIEETLETLRDSERQSLNAVTVACSVGVATYWLMPRLGGFYEAHPELTVNVITTQSGSPDLAEGIDLAIRFGHGRWTDGLVTRLFDEVVEPLCSPALKARHEGPVPLATTALLHVKAPETSWVTWAEYLRRTGLRASGRGSTFTNYVQTTQAALEARGLMLGWRSISGGLVASGQLVPAGLPRITPPDAFFLVARAKRGGLAAETFATWLAGTPWDERI
ncbi:MAG: LysR substrate-binding domain-containing protein [Pseudomonadota bacterium]